MNERIRALADQCQIETYGVNGELLYEGLDQEKFAQLIVAECVDYCGENLSRTVGGALKIHFGVEL